MRPLGLFLGGAICLCFLEEENMSFPKKQNGTNKISSSPFIRKKIVFFVPLKKYIMNYSQSLTAPIFELISKIADQKQSKMLQS